MRLALVPVLLLALAACAGAPAPYQPRADGEGYVEQQLDARTWRVSFAGNFATPRETVEDYALYRAAEIMRFGGYDAFVILEKTVEPEVEYQGSGYDYGYPYYGPPWPYRRHPVYGYRYGPYYEGPRTYTQYTRYTVHLVVRVYEGGPAPEGKPVYRASEIIRQLGPTIRLPGETGGY